MERMKCETRRLAWLKCQELLLEIGAFGTEVGQIFKRGLAWLQRELGSRFEALSPGAKIAAILCLVAGSTILLLAQSSLSSSSTGSGSKLCESCHSMESAWDLWKTSGQQSLGCTRCHLEDVGHPAAIILSALDSSNVGKRGFYVSDYVCSNCHGRGTFEWSRVANTVGHKVHAEQARIQCTTCHSLTAHQIERTDDLCLKCHSERQKGGEKAIKIAQMSSLHCLDCHEFLRPDSPLPSLKPSLKPDAKACLGCHKQLEPTQWTDDAPMRFECWRCHQPHESVKTVVKGCDSCHQWIRPVALHEVAAHSKASCSSCHLPHVWRIEARSCLRCHANRLSAGKYAFS